MKKINVVFMRGIMGNIYSRGMDVLGSKIAKIEGVDYVTVEDYGSWRSIRDRLARWRDPTVLMGHSFGGNAATIIAESVSIQIPLIITVDPSPYWSWSLWQAGPSRIGKNVAKTINFYQTSGLIGRVTLSGHNVTNWPVNSSHTDIDDDARIHSEAVLEVRNLIASLNRPMAA